MAMGASLEVRWEQHVGRFFAKRGRPRRERGDNKMKNFFVKDRFGLDRIDP
jgi:hypothetical protein